MISRGMTRAEMIRWLGEAISTETEKPFEEIDCDYVDTCGYLLDELMSKSAAMSEEEIADRIAKLKPGRTSAVRKSAGTRYRKAWNVAVAAAIVLCTSITVVAVPELRVRLMNVLQFNVGGTIEEGGITYIYNGQEIQYSSMEEAVLENKELDFTPPLVQSESLKLEKVIFIAETNSIFLCYNDTSISYEILLDNNDITSYIDNAIEYFINGYTSYIVSFNTEISRYYSYTVVDNDVHIISSNDIKDIELLISSIN